jgi:hypothetical protein
MSRNSLSVDVDGLDLVVTRSGHRTSLTGCRDALNGYQKGKCFYCFCDIRVHAADVDHFLPHTLKQLNIGLHLDGVWNLVLACRDCNRGVDGKSSRTPHRRLLERLDSRNEFFIGSHHPLRETLLAQTGQTRQERIHFLNAVYDTAEVLADTAGAAEDQRRKAPKSESPEAFQNRKVKSRRSSVRRRRSAESTHPRIFSTVPVRRDEAWLDGLRAKMQESFRSLAPSIHLVVVRPSRKSRAFR